MYPAYVLGGAAHEHYRFNLKAGNGQVILTSEAYSSKEAAKHGIDSVRVNSALDERYDRCTAKDGRPYFVLKAANTQIIGQSQMYSSATAMEHGIESVKTNGPESPIIEETSD
ncbi:MAG: hypothetical protein CVT66_08645 [Actinobacteria bacterium HGW-Actinobacteria-6]|nr:MAG: hypothetical protein CVT66_08645 [Actinobacteria bacterium HGW-Actinobacteria-6]